MIFGFNRQPELLDNDSVVWMFDVFDWAFANFGNYTLPGDKVLIFPSNDHFPGRETSVEGMAALIFSQVKDYLGIPSLACDLQNEHGISHSEFLRSDGTELLAVTGTEPIVFTYHSHTLNNPEVLIATFVHQVAYYIIGSAHNPPPGGKENWPHTAELLAVFMGFGVIMANTANTQKIRSCSSCSGPAVERESFLSQYDVTYALAIFCALKHIPVKIVIPHLKKTLRTFYKKAYKDINKNKLSAINKPELLKTTYSLKDQNITKGNH